MLRAQCDNTYSTPLENKIIDNLDKFCNELTITTKPKIYNIILNSENIVWAVNSIASNAAARPDGFHERLLKNSKEELALSLKLLWTKSLKTGCIPPVLTTGFIAPFHKGGSKGQT